MSGFDVSYGQQMAPGAVTPPKPTRAPETPKPAKPKNDTLTEAIGQLAEAVGELTTAVRKASEPPPAPEMRPPPDNTWITESFEREAARVKAMPWWKRMWEIS